jgi:hypothetical protein
VSFITLNIALNFCRNILSNSQISLGELEKVQWVGGGFGIQSLLGADSWSLQIKQTMNQIRDVMSVT